MSSGAGLLLVSNTHRSGCDMGKSAGRLSSLDLLPPEADQAVFEAFQGLRKRKRTQAQLLDDLNKKLAVHGLGPISASAFNRAAVRKAHLAHRLGEVREIAEALSTKLADGGDEDLTLLVSETIKTLVFEMAENASDLKFGTHTSETIANLANALKSAEQAKKISADTRKIIETNFKKTAEAAIEKVSASRGLSPEIRNAFKKEVLGVR
jgi:hypothetical protein